LAEGEIRKTSEKILGQYTEKWMYDRCNLPRLYGKSKWKYSNANDASSDKKNGMGIKLGKYCALIVFILTFLSKR